jgi:hypothetical protein
VRGGFPEAGPLLLNGGAIRLTNVIVFALWYWEADRGGPAARANAREDYPDFLFPQMTTPEMVGGDWEPYFVDYLYLSFTNATAFSPTDTMPLSRWAKLTMMAQSAVSLLIVALVVARAGASVLPSLKQASALLSASDRPRGDLGSSGSSLGSSEDRRQRLRFAARLVRFEIREESCPQRGGALGEGPLRGCVLGTAIGRLDAYRRVAQISQVVRAGAHVQRADVAGQREAVGDELGAGERAELVGPLVQIHVGV